MKPTQTLPTVDPMRFFSSRDLVFFGCLILALAVSLLLPFSDKLRPEERPARASDTSQSSEIRGEPNTQSAQFNLEDSGDGQIAPGEQSDGANAESARINDGPSPMVFRDYAEAYFVAKQRHKLLLILFEPENRTPILEQQLREWATRFGAVCEVASVPLGHKIRTVNGEVVLQEDSAFAALKGKPGVAIVSFRDGEEPGEIIAIFPCGDPTSFAPHQFESVTDFVAGQMEKRAQSKEENSRGASSASGVSRMARDEAATGAEVSDVTLATHLAPLSNADIWLTDYHQGVAQARQEKKMLLVYLYPENNESLREEFENTSLKDSQVLAELVRFVRVRLPESATIERAGQLSRLLDEPMLSEMENQPGLFIVDYASEGEKYYSQVVSVFPFLDGKAYRPNELLAILTLPPGTLTQRTLVYAVRVHPEHPQSVFGRPDPILFSEAEKHSEYQARIWVQGHHFWDSRFARIIRAIRGGHSASEVCAESWPGQGLLRAALECVRCWRLSPGHWREVVSRQEAYGYDMKRGSNGVWYATGIFVNR